MEEETVDPSGENPLLAHLTLALVAGVEAVAAAVVLAMEAAPGWFRDRSRER